MSNIKHFVSELLSEPTFSLSELLSLVAEPSYASWIPTFLELNAVGFYLLLVKQVVYVYCQCHINKVLYA